MPFISPEHPSNPNILLSSTKIRDDIQYTRDYLLYPKIPEIPEDKKDTRKYPIVFFDTPTPPKPDPLPGILSNTRPNIEKPYPLGTGQKVVLLRPASYKKLFASFFSTSQQNMIWLQMIINLIAKLRCSCKSISLSEENVKLQDQNRIV